ncbi:MAG: hypothetical protein AVDCRST_MAG08-2910, partial [uncultured Acetobacteraceae bacterium]
WREGDIHVSCVPAPATALKKKTRCAVLASFTTTINAR